MNESIQKGLEELFEEVIPLSQQFSEDNYEKNFMEKFNEYRPLFDEIIASCESSEDSDSVMKEIAQVLPDKIHHILDLQTSKRKKENVLLPYNMAMSTYVIPLIRYTRSDVLEELVDLMVESWNDNGVSLDIKKTTFENIKTGFKTRLCYITTAVCESLGKGDDCYELNLLRDFRDNYLLSNEDGKKLVDEYYDIAPTIVKRINKCDDAKGIYHTLWEDYIQPCIKMIESGKLTDCGQKYKEMVTTLQKKYLYT